jgi:hypothetical protein
MKPLMDLMLPDHVGRAAAALRRELEAMGELPPPVEQDQSPRNDRPEQWDTSLPFKAMDLASVAHALDQEPGLVLVATLRDKMWELLCCAIHIDVRHRNLKSRSINTGTFLKSDNGEIQMSWSETKKALEANCEAAFHLITVPAKLTRKTNATRNALKTVACMTPEDKEVVMEELRRDPLYAPPSALQYEELFAEYQPVAEDVLDDTSRVSELIEVVRSHIEGQIRNIDGEYWEAHMGAWRKVPRGGDVKLKERLARELFDWLERTLQAHADTSGSADPLCDPSKLQQRMANTLSRRHLFVVKYLCTGEAVPLSMLDP